MRCLFAVRRDDDDDKKSPTLAERMLTLFRSTTDGARSRHTADAGVTTVDMELDAPDDVVDVVPRPSGVDVELVDSEDPVTLSDASLDRIANERAAALAAIQPSSPAVQSPAPSSAPSAAPIQARSCAASCSKPSVCGEAPCAVADAPPCAAVSKAPSCAAVCGAPAPCADTCPVRTAAQVPACDVAPAVRCARSLERLGVACPSDVCPCPVPVAPCRPAAVSTTHQMCQTEPPPPPPPAAAAATSPSSRSSRSSRVGGGSGSLVTGTESETDFDELYETDDVPPVS